MQTVTFANLWCDGQWQSDVAVEIDAQGAVIGQCALGGRPRTGEYVPGLTLPGLADAHCHAFQRLLPGWTQRAVSGRDDFWSWREAMYAAAGALDASELEAIAARCYLDLLRGGYTGVAEFLYLHRLDAAPEDPPDADLAIARAAQRVGLRLTLLPALYQHGDFGGGAPRPGQQPFLRESARFLADWAVLKERHAQDGPVVLGIAFHSLRAVDIETVAQLHATLRRDPRCAVFHIHVAEQPAEVAACRARHGVGPVELLAARGLIDRRWALVHGTHASEQEFAQIDAAGAVLVLCPTTEADLGDGIIAVQPYLARGGRIALGSDSNIGVSALAELRQLEWSARLASGRRNVLTAPGAAIADRLFAAALCGGWQALAHSAPRADFVTFDAGEGDWAEQPSRNWLSALVFGAGAPLARDVMVRGRWVIRHGAHPEQARIEADYRASLARLRPRLEQALLA